MDNSSYMQGFVDGFKDAEKNDEKASRAYKHGYSDGVDKTVSDMKKVVEIWSQDIQNTTFLKSYFHDLYVSEKFTMAIIRILKTELGI